MRFVVFLLFVILLFPENLSSQQKADQPKVGVVLSGGGAKGFAHIGALKVLVEAGVPIDYIGGTSMGGLMGGLFSLGYSPDTLEKIVLSQDWMSILSDKISRNDLSLPEKEEDGKYFFTLPFRQRKIQLPSGLTAGQSVYNILSYYSSAGFYESDFRKFPIPFLCVATDIETGESVTLDHGCLADAMRATMAIPTIFAPVLLDGKLLVDGGLVNNYPVKEVQEMGADIIIGVDVQGELYNKIELNSLFKILDQSTAFLRKPLYNEGLQETDILIKPDLKGFGVSSFTSADTIIKLGEMAARQKLPEILKLVDSLKMYGQPIEKKNEFARPVDSIFVQEVVILGLTKVSPGIVTGYLDINVPEYVHYEKLIHSVERLYGTRSFEHITYNLQELERGGWRINLYFKEKQGADLQVGLNYNTDFSASVLINTTMRNFLLPGGRFSASVDLGENSAFEVEYLVERGIKPGIGARIKTYNADVSLFDLNQKIATFGFSSIFGNIYTQSNIRDFSAFGFGVEFEYSSVKSDVFSEDFTKTYEYNTNLFGFLKLDDLDRAVFPRKGNKLHSELVLVTDIEDSLQRKSAPTLFFTTRYFGAVPVNKKLTLQPQVLFGSVLSHGSTIPPQYNMFMGSLTDKYGKGVFPFIGLQFMQITNLQSLACRLDIQYEIFPNFFATAKYNLGFHSFDLEKIFYDNPAINGYGFTLGINTLLGPVELTLMNSDYSNKWIGYLNIGYVF